MAYSRARNALDVGGGLPGGSKGKSTDLRTVLKVGEHCVSWG